MSLTVSDSGKICKIRIITNSYHIAFNIYHSNQGAQGLLRTPSKQQLENTFGTSKDVEIIQYMLEHGKEQPSEGFKGTATKNVARSSMTIDTRGKSLFGV